jgi:tetratricopeptide (TPR) repeat protein
VLALNVDFFRIGHGYSVLQVIRKSSLFSSTMLKLILRQLQKYRIPLLFLIVLWVVSGYYIFESRFALLSFLYRITRSLPEPGTQNPVQAYAFIEDALSALEDGQIDLRRMATACPATLKHSYRPDEEYFQTDWLQRYLQRREFTEDADLSSDRYWMQHRKTVATALHSLLEATLYAYEIPEEVTKKESLLVPELVEKLSEALCNPYPALRVWGDYVHFQEKRAYRLLLEAEKDLELLLPFPAEQELLVLGTLKNRGEYIMALRRYAGGPAPSDPDEACTDFRLVCIAPAEAARVIDKLIYTSPEDRRGMLYLNQARIYLRLNRKDDREKALNRFEGATADRSTEIPARLEMGALLARDGRYDEAYRQLHILDVIMGPQRKHSREFRALARSVLIGTGRFVEADCFSDESERGGLRPACVNFRL